MAVYSPSVVKHLKSDYNESNYSLAKTYLSELRNHGARVYDLLNILESMELSIQNDAIEQTNQSNYLENWFKRTIRERYKNSWKKV